MIELSVIVPIYNEVDYLWKMASELSDQLDRVIGPGRWQFILVDNGSTDGSDTVVTKIMSAWKTSVSVKLDRPDYGEALAHGLARAQGEWAYIINVDFWDGPMLNWCWHQRQVYDLMIGSKRADPTLNHQHGYRRLLSWGLNTLLQTVLGFVGSDTHGQKFLHMPSMQPLLERCVMRRGQFDTEFTLRALREGLWLAEIPVPIVDSRPPRNMMIAKVFRNFVDVARLRKIISLVPSDRPLRYHRWAREDVTSIALADSELSALPKIRRRQAASK